MSRASISRAIGFIVLACLLLIGLTTLGGLHLGAKSEQIAAWVAALGTVGALGAAGVAAVFAFDALRRERERDDWRDKQDEARQASVKAQQASLVAAWIGFDDASHPPVKDMMGNTLRRAPGVWIRNASDVPVIRMAAQIKDGNGTIDLIQVKVVPPSATPTFLPYKFDHSKWAVAEDEHAVRLVFRDSTGTWWDRTRAGTLRPAENVPEWADWDIE